MDLARTLIRTVARAFYETRHILIIDALFIHSVLHAEDLAYLLGMQQKDLRKLCGRLREDRLIAIHARPETRDGQTRPVNREYYYVPLHPVIDAVKYRISRLTSIIKAQYTPSAERKDYICERCGAEWTQLEVLSNVGTEGFECHRCGSVLSRVDELNNGSGPDRTGHEKNSKLMAQLDTMLKLLKQIDSVEIPPNEFESAWGHKVDVVRNQATHPTRAAFAFASNRQNAVRGISKTDASTIEVSLTSSAEKSAAEQAELAARKAVLEKQNALPIWHTQSTVNIDSSVIPTVKAETNGVNAEEEQVDIKGEGEDQQKSDFEDLDDKMAAYYAEVAREKEKEAREDESSAEEDEDEEDEFEEVGIAPSNSLTPAAPVTPSPTENIPASNGTLKRELDSEPSSSGPQTSVTTPDTFPQAESPSKRIKLQIDGANEEESDEDEEFEDV